MTKNQGANFIFDYKPDENARVELKNGKLVDVVKGCFFPKNTRIIIEGGTIIDMPRKAKGGYNIKVDYSIDLQGKTVIPSLFNTHCHTSVTSPTLIPSWQDIKLAKKLKGQQQKKTMVECLSRGVTNIRDAYTEDLRITGNIKTKISNGIIAGPRIMQSIVVGPSGSYLNEKHGIAMRFIRSKFGLPVMDRNDKSAGCVEFPIDGTEQQVRDAVNRAIDERGAEVIKIGEQIENMSDFKPTSTIMSQKQLTALVDQARKRGLKSTIHQVSVETFRRGIKAGVSSMAHMARDAYLTQKDIKIFLASGCILDPTLSVSYGLVWKIKGDPWCDHPELEALTEFRKNEYSYKDLTDDFYVALYKNTLTNTSVNLNAGKFKTLGLIDITRLFKYYSNIVQYGNENYRKLFENGATMTLANDGGVPPCTPASIGLELLLHNLVLEANSKGKQMDGKTALRIATINSAKSLGIEDQFGTIETGKTADLVILNSNPLDDFTVLGKPVGALFMDGKLVIDNCRLKVTTIK